MMSLGFDPGANCGWAALDIHAAGRDVRWCAAGVLEGPDAVGDARRLIELYRPEFVGVETVESVFGREGFSPSMAGHLLRAARLGGKLEMLGEQARARVVTFQAAEWRKALVGNGQASNNDITNWIKLRVRGWPATSNNHQRDAGGVALFAHESARLGSMRSRG